MWLTQPRHLRRKDFASTVAIALCIKITYFVDSQSSLNFKTDSELIEWKLWLNKLPEITTFAPLFLMFMLENKINRHHNFAKLHALMSHGLTLMVAAYYYIQIYAKPDGESKFEGISEEL
jgi:hypothetical protein